MTAASDWMVAGAGSNHTLAIRQDGTLWAWGCNDHGELGQDPVEYPTIRTPTEQIGTDTDWVAVSGGYHYSLALKSNGTLWAWGYNNDGGQLGDGTVAESHAPKQVGSATDWVKFDAGYHHSLGIKTDGTLWAWGYNNEGQAGRRDGHGAVDVDEDRLRDGVAERSGGGTTIPWQSATA